MLKMYVCVVNQSTSDLSMQTHSHTRPQMHAHIRLTHDGSKAYALARAVTSPAFVVKVQFRLRARCSLRAYQAADWYTHTQIRRLLLACNQQKATKIRKLTLKTPGFP